MGKPKRHPKPNTDAQDVATLVPDRTDAEVEALLCALRAAPGFWLTQPTLQRLVTDTSQYVDTYSRALHQIERRTVSLHTAPASSRRAGPVQQLPNPGRLDPWSVDPAEIEAASRVISTCPTCHGAETVACGRCSGSARVSCSHCWGSGRVRGQRGMKNCDVCRGRGNVVCGACSNGRVPCELCDATGRVWAWLSIAQTRMSQVRVHPMGAAASVHRKLQSPEDFDAGPKNWVNTLISDTGPQEPPRKLPQELAADTNSITDRVLSTRLQSFSSVVHRFTYEAARMTGFIEVAGSPPAVSGSSNWRPLRLRQAAVAGVAICGGIASLSLMGSYAARHSWYAMYGHSGLIALLGIIIAGLARSSCFMSLPRRIRICLGPWAAGERVVPSKRRVLLAPQRAADYIPAPTTRASTKRGVRDRQLRGDHHPEPSGAEAATRKRELRGHADRPERPLDAAPEISTMVRATRWSRNFGREASPARSWRSRARRADAACPKGRFREIRRVLLPCVT